MGGSCVHSTATNCENTAKITTARQSMLAAACGASTALRRAALCASSVAAGARLVIANFSTR